MPDISSSLSKREVNARQNTYTKSEIDLKDGAIQAIAEAAQTTADAAEKKNQKQDQLIAELQKSSHSHSNQAVLDKTEQPYTTAERDKLAGLENYTHPTHTAHTKGFYKFASDGEGHVTDAEAVTKKDITALGIPGENTNTTYELSKDGSTIKMTGSDGTSSSVTDSDTTYELVQFYINNDPDGPLISLKDSNSRHSLMRVPNTFTLSKTDIQIAIGRYVNIRDDYNVILDLAFFASSGFGDGMDRARDYPVIIDSYITLNFGELITKRFLVRIITSALSDVAIVPARAIVRQLDSTSAYSNMKWQVFLGYTDDTARKGLVTAIRICLHNNTYSDITGIKAKTFTYFATSIYGELLERPRLEINTYDITTTEIDTIFELSSQNASDVAFTGDYNDLSNKPTIPDISGKQDKLTAGANITISGNTISAKDTTYTSKSAVSGGKDVSLVTTGEKAIWNAKTSNVGTITGIKMNGASKGTSGVVDLGTVITAHQDISGKQDKSTAVTHTANTAVGSTAKPVYIAADGKATPITHSVNSDVPSNAKFTDTVYTHPTTAGNKHIPAGGSSGQILRWSADGTAVWGADNNTTYSDATQSTHGLMTAADKKKLDGMDLSKYLPKSGGVMTGNIDMQTNKKDILVGTQKATASDGTAVAGGLIEKRANMTSTLPEMRSFIGSFHNTNIDRFYSLISVRHRNGHSDGNVYGMYIFSDLTSADGNLKWGKQTAAKTWTDDFVLLDSRNFTRYAAKSDHTHAALANNYLDLGAAGGTVKWIRLGTIVSGGDGKTMVIRVWSGDGFNALTSQNSSFEIHIKDSFQGTPSSTKACAATVYRINCPDTVTVKIISTDALTYTVWIHPSPWTYWNGNYSVYGYYKTWTRQFLTQDAEPTGTGAPIAYYDQAFLTSTVAAANTLTDSGWVATTRNTSFTATSTVKCRKYGQLVEVRGEVTFSDTCGSPTVCTLPAGYRPATVVQACGITPSGKQYMIKADTSGVISFGSDSGSTFVNGTTYRVDLTYLLG